MFILEIKHQNYSIKDLYYIMKAQKSLLEIESIVWSRVLEG